MPAQVVSVVNTLGMHARAAARFVKTASRYEASVRVTSHGTTADGKSILGLLFLAASKGSQIRITTTGPEGKAALSALTRLVEAGMGDPDFAGETGRKAREAGTPGSRLSSVPPADREPPGVS